MEIRKLTPVIAVDAIEPCLSFWTDRLGFEKTAEVPEGERLGFVILAKDGVEIMYQTHASIANDIPSLAQPKGKPTTGFFIEVSDIDATERALQGLEQLMPRRTTFYGMEEVGVREPGGHAVIFAQPKEAPTT
jgi:uncharacterized glyoxalase superfamily protein PhnB